MEYELIRKNVRNINLRVKPDLTIVVSAPRGVSKRDIDDFLLKKQDWIHQALLRYQGKILLDHTNLIVDDDLVRQTVNRIIPLFEGYSIPTPIVKLRAMKTRWGSCMVNKGVITLNKLLLKTPVACMEYVIAHEIAHFIQPNHSKAFYGVLEKVMPDYKVRKKQLEQYRLQ